MTDTQALFADLAAEGDALDALVADLSPQQWRSASASPGWTAAHQIAHLTWTDDIAILAATDPDGFAARLKEAIAAPTSLVDNAAAEGAQLPPADLLGQWRKGRSAMVDALKAVPPGQKLPWFGPPMSAASMATARIMETWAHGQDIVDGLGLARQPTARLRHVAHIGVRTVGFAFMVHNLPVPAEPFRVELTGPNGAAWTWGRARGDEPGHRTRPRLLPSGHPTPSPRRPATSSSSVNRLRQWATIAQAFAGLPGEGRKAGQFQ